MASSQLQSIIRQAELLSPEEQLVLITYLAETARRHYQASTRRRTLDHALGLLATGQPAPTDAEIDHWLEAHREEKYG